ncbi:MAG: (d)CMP kinase [Hyphomicrobiaceae bacterium]
MIIAIDGPAASGKGTLARLIARHLGFHHLDTGLLYRAVARRLRSEGLRLDDRHAGVAIARSLDEASLLDPALRDAAAGEDASVVARIPEVRQALLEYQRDFARRQPGAVLDGRDIGTVICPNAEVKIFVTAASEERAARRFRELVARGEDVDFSEIHEQIRMRDRRDADRASAPLRAADDALLLDTTGLDIESAFRAALDLINRKTGLCGCA